jgi:quercetin dioxygenase-like cupin family protein
VKEITEQAQNGVLANEVTGARITLRRRPAEAGAERVLEVEAWLPQGWRDPRRHRHPGQEERVRVLEGRLVAEIGGWSRTYSPGEALIIPVGVDHSLWVVSEAAHVVIEFTPPLETASLLALLQRLATAGHVDRSGWPRPLVASLIARRFAQEFVVAKPPRVSAAIGRATLAGIATALGRKTIVSELAADPTTKEHS